MPLTIRRNDIINFSVDAIVNAANTSLQMGGGVCGAIFRAAGETQLQAACNALAPIQTGGAVITPGFKLPAKYIIHTAGPVYRNGNQGEAALLRACYLNSLKLAGAHECESVAFPLISSGIYGYPKAEALRVATGAIRSFISENDIDVTLVVFDKEALSVSEELLDAAKSYIDEHYVEEQLRPHRQLLEVEERALSDADAQYRNKHSMPKLSTPSMAAPTAVGLDALVDSLDEPFSATLFRLIDATGRKDAEVYRRANIDRRLFSKIRGNPNYAPSKPNRTGLRNRP